MDNLSFLKEIFSNLPEIVFVVEKDEGNNIIYANKNFFDFFEEAKNLESLDIESLNSLIYDEIENHYIELDIPKYGKRKMLLTVIPFSFEDKEYSIVQLKDITLQEEKREINGELLKKLKDVQKLEALGLLASGMCHDVNNIIGGIMGFAEIALKEMDMGGNPKEEILNIVKLCERCANILNSLFQFARKKEVNKINVDINKLINETLKLLSRVLGNKINIEFYPDNKLKYYVEADPSGIEQCIINLCSNAKDAMPDGGTLIIETEQVKLGKDYFSKHPEGELGDYCMISVTDTGYGIKKEDLSKVFDPFFTTKKDGTGLGLSIVHGIVHQHKGFINVYSEIGKGTTFKIYIPSTDKIVEEPGEYEKTSDIEGNETILIVEDDKNYREILKNGLSYYGYSVITIDNCEEALNLIIKSEIKIDFACY